VVLIIVLPQIVKDFSVRKNIKAIAFFSRTVQHTAFLEMKIRRAVLQTQTIWINIHFPKSHQFLQFIFAFYKFYNYRSTDKTVFYVSSITLTNIFACSLPEVTKFL